ncbi:MAG: Nif3-like dinuclear metal center hexameric protein [Bacteroidetes bacterium]|nr:MAG: Nif3-like dinuclear metal center hexameric protein [Bacteroidota bacterium]
MKIKELTEHLENFAPPVLQESYDNAGLIIGDPETEIKGVMICLDSTEAVLDEAIQTGCNLILAHHPIIFSGLKKITGKNYIERVVLNAIKNEIAIYASHTNLDNVRAGVNAKIAERLGLKDLEILSPKTGILRKLVTYCPLDRVEEIRNALFNAGGGTISDYSECSFNIIGTGTFKAGASSSPYLGKVGERHRETEERIELVYEFWKEPALIKALLNTHPYEEVAYDIYNLENAFQSVGSGIIGTLPTEMPEREFLLFLKSALKTDCVRHSGEIRRNIRKVAICGGSGSFLLNSAIKNKADAFVSADFKYHQFFDADGHLLIADVGHYESEQFTMELLNDIISKKNPTFAVRLTKVITNSVHYT